MTEFENAIYRNLTFTSNIILRPRASAIRGFRVGYPDGTRGILWLSGKKYYIRIEMLGTIFNVNVPKHLGKQLLEDFFLKYGTEKVYEDI
jgi:hypothetical protein